MKKLSKKEKLAHAKRQLSEFIKMHPEERMDNFYKLKHSILRIYNIIFSNGFPNLEPSYIEMLNLDQLYIDIELIPFYRDDKNTISYASYQTAKKMPYPCGIYEIVNPVCGMYKFEGNNTILISNRIAIDYKLEEIAQRWLNGIPTFLKLLESSSG